MKKQSITAASIPSAATNSHLKGLQQYFTPSDYAAALAAAWPSERRSIADLHCGNGSLLRGLANSTTREVIGCDIDPASTLGGPKTWQAAQPSIAMPLTHHAHGDVLDLFPLLLETGTRFDLLSLNPPFSLTWPLKLLPEPLRKGLTGKTIDSTHATLRMIPHLLTELGEAMLIGNASTLQRLKDQFPEDFAHVWLHLEIPSFFPGVDKNLMLGVLYLCGQERPPIQRFWDSWSHHLPPDTIAAMLDALRRKCFTADCITQPWQATTAIARAFTACTDEMERRRDPSASQANVTIDTEGRVRTWISVYQEKSSAIPAALVSYLRTINRKHPLELTLQRGARMALQQAIDSGYWTIDPRADDVIRQSLADFDRDRAPLTPVSNVQRIGWIDDAEELLCTRDFAHFQAGQKYPLSTKTIDWKKNELRPRYHAGKRDTEQILVRGTELQITLHHESFSPVHFIFNPDKASNLHATHNLEDLAAHFALPEVQDITHLKPEQFATNLALLDELESLTPA